MLSKTENQFNYKDIKSFYFGDKTCYNKGVDFLKREREEQFKFLTPEVFSIYVSKFILVLHGSSNLYIITWMLHQIIMYSDKVIHAGG